MAGNIDSDYKRFREIIKGHVRENLREYITNGEIIGREGKDYVRVPLPHINLPKFIYDDSDNLGVGQGDGQEGDPTDWDFYGDEAGKDPGELVYDAELSIEELAEILGERLDLGELKPKSVERILEEKDRYKSIRRTGPESLRHFKRTYRTALKRTIASGLYDPKNPVVVPIRPDKYYRSWVKTPEPNAKAVVFHMRDISGSMDDDKVDIVRNMAWWEDAWIRHNYKDRVHHVYLVHHSDAWEVGREDFFNIFGSGGGTVISSILNLASSMFTGATSKFNHEHWNVYMFYYSDGENWADDNKNCMNTLQEKILPHANSFCYGHISEITSDFLKGINKLSADNPNLRYHEIPKKLLILDALKKFLQQKKEK